MIEQNPYFFHLLVAISFGFATLSAALYLKRHGMLSLSGAMQKKRYISTMYASTLGVNLLLFMFIFPAVANIQPAAGLQLSALSNVTLKVSIPCSGHALLITGELMKVEGVQNAVFRFPDLFDVGYDPSKVSPDDMLALDVFKTYKCEIA